MEEQQLVYELSMLLTWDLKEYLMNEQCSDLRRITAHSPLSYVLDHQVAADVKGDILSNVLYILIIFKWQIHKDSLSK